MCDHVVAGICMVTSQTSNTPCSCCAWTLPPPRLCLMPLLSSHVRQGGTVTGQAKPARFAQECVQLGMSVQVSLRHPPKARAPWGTIVGEDSDSHVPKADSGIFARHRKSHCCVCASVAPTPWSLLRTGDPQVDTCVCVCPVRVGLVQQRNRCGVLGRLYSLSCRQVRCRNRCSQRCWLSALPSVRQPGWCRQRQWQHTRGC